MKPMPKLIEWPTSVVEMQGSKGIVHEMNPVIDIHEAEHSQPPSSRLVELLGQALRTSVCRDVI